MCIMVNHERNQILTTSGTFVSFSDSVSVEDLVDLSELSLPKSSEFNRQLLLSSGIPIPPLIRLEMFSEDEFEDFTLELVDGALKKKYTKVMRVGGANDLGRDVIGLTDNPNVWDNYQCKHYGNKLMPSDFWIEIGKVCFYTLKGLYTFPRKYFIVTCKGIGATLSNYFQDPQLLKDEFLKNWDSNCMGKITKTENTPLTPALRDHIESLDFSRFEPIEPLDLIALHAQTRYHAFRFGGGLKKRPIATKPPLELTEVELEYTSAIFDAFSHHTNSKISTLDDVNDAFLRHAFHRAREGFYSAESLKEFVRDQLPDDDDFEELLIETFDSVESTVLSHFSSAFERMRNVEDKAILLPFNGCILAGQVKTKDKIGFCHHLTNQRRMKWIQ